MGGSYLIPKVYIQKLLTVSGGYMNCPHCGTENIEGSTFCRNCGAALQPEKKEMTQPPPVKSEIPVTFTQVIVPALICGIPAGILSTVVLDDLCCLWVILAGGLAVFLVKRFNKIKGKIPTGKAFIAGGLAGLVAGLMFAGYTATVTSQTDFDELMEEAMTSPEWEEAMEDSDLTEEEMQEMQEFMEGFSSSFFQIGLLVIVIAALALSPILAGLTGVVVNEITK